MTSEIPGVDLGASGGTTMTAELERPVTPRPSTTVAEPLRDPTFARLWFAQVVSSLGTEVSALAIPLIAVVALAAPPAGVAALTAAAYLPALILGLPAGSLADRGDQRHLLVACDLFRALTLLVIPIGWTLGWVGLPALAVVVFLVGCGSVVFDVALQALTPRLVRPERLVLANARLQLGVQGAGLAGPLIGGILVAVVSAPLAVLADAASYVATAGLLIGMRSPERDRGDAPPADGARNGLTAGLRYVISDPILRASAAASFTAGLGTRAVQALLVLALVRVGGLGPATVGLVFTAGGLGFVVGAAVADRTIARAGVGVSSIVGLLIVALTVAAIAVAPDALFGPAVAIAFFIHGCAAMIYNVATVSIRQVVAPRPLIGRVSAAVRMLSWASFPVGALLGGTVASILGIRPAIAIAAVATLLGVVPLVRSPIRRIGRLEEVAARAA